MKQELLQNFGLLKMFIDEMNESSSGNYKIDVLKKYEGNEFLARVFNYTYNDFKKYGVQSSILIKHSDLIDNSSKYDDLFNLLDDLSKSILTGHDAIKALNAYTRDLPDEYVKLVHYILDHDLHIGASTTTILKVFPYVVPVFKVALANPYEPKRVDFITEDWYASRKLDGVRCICIKEGNSVSFYSRTGKEFLTLGSIEKEILKIDGDFVMDGEVCIVDGNGKEDFQGIMKEIRKKNHTISTPRYYVFDFLSIDEFNNKKGKEKLSKRLAKCKDTLKDTVDNNILTFLPQTLVKEETVFAEMVKDAEDNGYEGIMLRKDIGYEGKRSHNLLKVKKFVDSEYEVLECVNGLIRWTENGQQVEKECLSSIVIEHKGNKVSVGSGFSKEQREYYYENPEELIGKVVTVQYFEESKNQTGGLSLRFPVVKHIYEEGRNV